MTRLPDGFIDRIESYRCPALDGLCDALASTGPQVSVRVNPLKGVAVPVGADTVEWCPCGFYLPERKAFTFDPALHQGLYYPQDASSMIAGTVAAMLAAGRPVRYLDACAAPGGKTTAAASVLPEGSLLVANEYVPARAAVLAENVAKWGRPDVVVTRGDTSRMRRLPGFFDIVAADVPCSGEGMMRKDAVAVEQWTPALVDECAARQREIVENLWEALRPGGYMIYSTCTFNRIENEDMLDFIISSLGGESVDLQLEKLGSGICRGITPDAPACARFMPHRLRGEGLFVGVVRKPDGPAPRSHSVKKAGPAAVDRNLKALAATARGWLTDPDSFVVEPAPNGQSLRAVPQGMVSDLRVLESVLDVVSAGVELATVKGRDLIPSQALAVSSALRADAFPRCEVGYPQAIAFLRRESVTLPDGLPRGIVLLTFGDRPLGFVKNLGNRANNLYPAAWRILSTRMPDSPPEIIKLT